MSKTVEEAAFEKWVDQNPLGRMSIHQSRRAAFAAGAAHGAAKILGIATTLPRIQVEGQWLIDLDELERRLTEE